MHALPLVSCGQRTCTFQDVAVTSRSSSCRFLAATCATLCVMLPSTPSPPRPPFVGDPPAGPAAAAAADEGPSASSACSCHHADSSSSLRSLPLHSKICSSAFRCSHALRVVKHGQDLDDIMQPDCSVHARVLRSGR